MPKKTIRAIPTPANQNGFAVRGFREKAGLSVQALADYVGITAPHMRNIENEHRNASPAHLNLIAKACDVNVAALRRDANAQTGADVA